MSTLHPHFLSVAVPRPVQKLFTYLVPDALLDQIKVGGVVKVPFGRSTTHAFIVEPPRPTSDLDPHSIKEILEVGTQGVLIPKDVLELCRFAQEFYCVSLGEVLCNALPLSFLKEKKPRASAPVPALSGFDVAQKIYTLTDPQKEALKTLEASASKVGLLHGVTGSGKTEIYIELARKTLQAGKGVLILVPEIALTSQLHERFEAGLGKKVGLWHSALSEGHRQAQVRELREGRLQVLVGARSAVFAPIQNLGLIVVDEEHDSSYKQEDRVRYHARDLAIVRGKITNSKVILGSATPSLETRERVQENKYTCARLTQRISQAGVPQIEVVRLTPENLVPNIQAALSQETLKAIQDTVSLGNQVLIYLNRRGFASCIVCQDCGEVPQCKNCSVSLTFYKKKNALQCHCCGYFVRTPETCKKCQSARLRLLGAGTESLEEELPKLVPEAKILRLDRDHVTSHTRLRKILEDFKNNKANVLLGTQMLVKGHDFPQVTLVVVVIADALFRWPDFRAPERAFQILTQVSGRAGRGEKPGRVIIQTYDESHPLMQTILGNQKEEVFLAHERELRQELGYPPFGRIAKFRMEGKKKEDVIKKIETIALLLKNDKKLTLLGPSEAFLERAKGVFRWDLLIKASTIQDLRQAIQKSLHYCQEKKWSYLVDMDPYSV